MLSAKCRTHEDTIQAQDQKIMDLEGQVKILKDTVDKPSALRDSNAKLKEDNMKLRRQVTQLKYQVSEWKERYAMKYKVGGARHKSAGAPVAPTVKELEDMDADE